MNKLSSVTILIFFGSLLNAVFGQDTINYKDHWLSFEGQIYPRFVEDNYKPQFKIRWNFNKNLL